MSTRPSGPSATKVWLNGRGERPSHAVLQLFIEGAQERFGRHPGLIWADERREVLGHLACLDGIDADAFERFGETDDIGCIVETAAMREPARPSEIGRASWRERVYGRV